MGKKLVHKEKEIDDLQKKIVEYINALMSHNLTNDTMSRVRKQLRLADEYESISDYLIVIMELRYKVNKNRVQFSDQDKASITELHKLVTDYVASTSLAVREADATIMEQAMSNGKIINRKVKQFRSAHLNNLGTDQ